MAPLDSDLLYEHEHASGGERAEDILDCGPLPLCGPALVVDIVGPAQVVLPLLPARGQCRQLVIVPRPGHILTLQKLPARLPEENRHLFSPNPTCYFTADPGSNYPPTWPDFNH